MYRVRTTYFKRNYSAHHAQQQALFFNTEHSEPLIHLHLSRTIGMATQPYSTYSIQASQASQIHHALFIHYPIF